ncbi:hypothetical protein GJ496_007589 [Pomphorhynchus laevis]|nr:hypothetical protein GJ496_007589 [Pomphorhynchus laevis]
MSLQLPDPEYIHSDRGDAFLSKQLQPFLLCREIAGSSNSYNSRDYVQCELLNSTIWVAITTTLMSRNLPSSS